MSSRNTKKLKEINPRNSLQYSYIFIYDCVEIDTKHT